MKHSCLAGTKVNMIGPRRMTKMAAIYGKETFENFLRQNHKLVENLAHSKIDLHLQKFYK